MTSTSTFATAAAAAASPAGRLKITVHHARAPGKSLCERMHQPFYLSFSLSLAVDAAGFSFLFIYLFIHSHWCISLTLCLFSCFNATRFVNRVSPRSPSHHHHHQWYLLHRATHSCTLNSLVYQLFFSSTLHSGYFSDVIISPLHYFMRLYSNIHTLILSLCFFSLFLSLAVSVHSTQMNSSCLTWQV